MSIKETKKMSPREFRDLGFLQEVNRRFLHPLGLALECVIDDETGECRFGDVWDHTDSIEGMLFQDLTDDESRTKASNVTKVEVSKEIARRDRFGFRIQPIGHKVSET